MRRYILLALSSIVLIAVLAACGPDSTQSAESGAAGSPTAKATPYVPEGWASYGTPTDGFVVAMPSDFKSFSTDPKDMDKTIADLTKTDPVLASGLAVFKSQSVLPSVLTFDLSPAGRAGGNLTSAYAMKLISSPARISLDDYVQSGMDYLAKNDDVQKPVKHERIKTSGGDFEKIEYTQKIPYSQKIAALYQLVGVNGNVIYELVLSTNTDQVQKYGPIFDQMAQTFQLK